MKLGLIVFTTNSGLGNQTRRLTYMLNPDTVLAIDSSNFSKNKEQHFDWYDNFKGYKIQGFPSNHEIKTFLKDLTHVFVCENPLNSHLLDLAKKMNIKVFIQSNYEFCDHLSKSLTLPYKFLMPSYWHVQTMKDKFGNDLVEYLPPPIDPQEFKEAREVNMKRVSSRKRILHIVGTLAAEDRNGTLDLLNSLKYVKSDFEIIIRSQHSLSDEYLVNDPRVKYVIENTHETQDLYKDFDFMVLPRRYGGLSLTTNEALISGLPVIMPNISPNDELLRSPWLAWAEKKTELYTRTWIDVYKTNYRALADRIDFICKLDGELLNKVKIDAFEIGYNNFSTTVLKPKYDKVLNS